MPPNACGGRGWHTSRDKPHSSTKPRPNLLRPAIFNWGLAKWLVALAGRRPPCAVNCTKSTFFRLTRQSPVWPPSA
jgi:hypothetical protein